ncbi:hypothetical protein VNI00_008185 [Paramarasmius palmivorus]|uniref:Agouti signaling protein n=1 Tax=Paramarasmius palmivorus TaxID=297713 RepID=A0AAW0CXQ6_9AGAR
MRHFRYLLLLSVLVLCLNEVLSAPAKPKKSSKALSAAKKPVATVKKPVLPAKKPAVKKPTTTVKKPVKPVKKPTTPAKKPSVNAACSVKPSKLTPRAPDPAEAGCGKHKTCDACVTKGKNNCGEIVCAFTEGNTCIGVSAIKDQRVAKSADQCDGLKNQPQLKQKTSHLEKEFANIEDHVFGREKNPSSKTSGRHLASALLRDNPTLSNPRVRVSNALTGLSRFSIPSPLKNPKLQHTDLEAEIA